MAVKLIYLDACALQRPMDELVDLAAEAEAIAIRTLLSATKAGVITLYWSAPLEYECITRAPVIRRRWSRHVRQLAKRTVTIGSSIIERATLLRQQLLLDPFDALHLAAAESVGAILVTVDKKLLKRTQSSPLVHTSVYEPSEAMLLIRQK